MRRKLVGTQTAPRRKVANIDQNISSQFLECTRMRSPLTMPRAASAAASAETCPSISRQVQDLSPQMKPKRSPCRRAFWVKRCARFITRRDIRFMPPRGALVAPLTGLASPSPHQGAAREQHYTHDGSNNAVLGMNVAVAGRMAREKGRQLVRRHQEIDRGNHQQHHAEQAQNEFHEISPPGSKFAAAG